MSHYMQTYSSIRGVILGPKPPTESVVCILPIAVKTVLSRLES